jgi:hypothetical protein
MRRGGSSDRVPENPTATLSAFRRSLANNEPPVGLMPALEALWWAGKDDWNKAHETVMDHVDPNSAWVHAPAPR